jgi:hypothetical protein
MKLQVNKIKPVEGYHVSEYLLVIRPNESLSEEIVLLKEKFYRQFRIERPVNKTIQIALVNFFQYDISENKMVRELKSVTSRISPPLIELDGFGSLPTHTIYINIATKQTLKDLIKPVRTHMQLLMKLNDENRPHFINELYFTVANKLMPWQYEKAWVEYGKKYFSGKFIATGLTLLMRDVETNVFKPLQYFQFGCAPVAESKALLFSENF